MSDNNFCNHNNDSKDIYDVLWELEKEYESAGDKYCNIVVDNVVDYYRKIQQDDDYYTVKRIKGEIISMLIRHGFDDLSLAINDISNSLSHLKKPLMNF